MDWQLVALGLTLRLPWMLQLVNRAVALQSYFERRIYRRQQATHARAAEALAQVRAIQAATAEPSEVAGYARTLGTLAAEWRVSARALALLENLEKVVQLGLDAGLLAFGAYRVYTGAMTFGVFNSCRAHLDQFIGEFQAVEHLYMGIRRAGQRSRVYFALLDRCPAIADREAAARMESAVADAVAIATELEFGRPESAVPASGLRPRQVAAPGQAAGVDAAQAAASLLSPSSPAPSIRFDRVCFSYDAAMQRQQQWDSQVAAGLQAGGDGSGALIDARYVLSDVTFEVPPRAVVAICGPSGSGKTTLGRMLLRFYDPATGRISIGGADIRTLPLQHLRSLCCSVDQETILFDRSILENILFALPRSQWQCTPGAAVSAGTETLEPRERRTRKAHASGIQREVDTVAVSPGLRRRRHSRTPAPGPRIRRTVSATAASVDLSDLPDDADTSPQQKASAVPARLRTEDRNGQEEEEETLASLVPRVTVGSVPPHIIARVFAASKLADAHGFISAMPEGYNTLAGERGSRLSGGERQRVLLARAFLRGSPVLLLDEATSALDAKSEATITESLRTLMQDRTVLCITHRLGLAQKADTILCM
jgi:ABC-type multidrug transport system fused ATPase/permease subunit